MKRLSALLMFIACIITAQAQDTTGMEPVGNSYNKSIARSYPTLHYSYIDTSQTHDYSGNWDFDGDGKADSIYFIGNGGAHLYFHLRLVLSSENRKRDFTWLTLDLPLPRHADDLKKGNEERPIMPQFVVADFDADGRPDIYLCFDDHYSWIPGKWKRRGVTSRHLLLTCKHKTIVIRNFDRKLLR